MPQNKSQMDVRKTDIRRFDKQKQITESDDSLNNYQK